MIKNRKGILPFLTLDQDLLGSPSMNEEEGRGKPRRGFKGGPSSLRKHNPPSSKTLETFKETLNF